MRSVLRSRHQNQSLYLIAALIAAMTLWRLIMAAILPVTRDEAYYFDWSRTLAWGYFDHPPGVAVLGLGVLLEPGSALAGRLGTLLAGLLTLIVLASLYRRVGLSRTRDLALALLLTFATLPGFASGLITTPDTLLALAWAMALHEGERALAGERWRWVTAGLASGIGLLGKYTMVLIGPVLLIALLRCDRDALRTGWPYLGAVAALLILTPHLAWNGEHDWITLHFQFGHGFSTATPWFPDEILGTIRHVGPDSLFERIGSLLTFLATQLALWGFLLIALLGSAWRRLRAQDEARDAGSKSVPTHARTLMVAATSVPLGFFALVALSSEVEANWAAMYLLSAIPLGTLLVRERPALAIAGALANLVLVSLYILHAASAALPLGDHLNRILRESHGFRELATMASKLGEPVYTDRYQTTAMLRFHAANPETTQWPGLSRPSEYLRGKIAPGIEPDALADPFWLICARAEPPVLEGFRADAHRILHTCAGQTLSEGQHPPCERPLHVWHLYRYLPTAPQATHHP